MPVKNKEFELNRLRNGYFKLKEYQKQVGNAKSAIYKKEEIIGAFKVAVTIIMYFVAYGVMKHGENNPFNFTFVFGTYFVGWFVYPKIAALFCKYYFNTSEEQKALDEVHKKYYPGVKESLIFLQPKYHTTYCLEYLYGLIESDRVSSFNEALNQLDVQLHRNTVEAQNREIISNQEQIMSNQKVINENQGAMMMNPYRYHD